MEDSKILKRKNVIIMILCFMMLLMGIGYAILASQLVININIKTSGVLNLRITNAIVKDISGSGKNVDGFPKWNYDSALLSAKLEKPNDSVTYTITVHNFGSIDAVLNDVLVTNPSNDYIEVTNNIDNFIELPVGEDISFDIIISFKDINVDYIPEDVILNTVITPDYIQKVQ
ncbi:MAG: hypothetical protein PUD59_05955 [bacterium]|nr:hypothetical protein [bacterium]